MKQRMTRSYSLERAFRGASTGLRDRLKKPQTGLDVTRLGRSTRSWSARDKPRPDAGSTPSSAAMNAAPSLSFRRRRCSLTPVSPTVARAGFTQTD